MITAFSAVEKHRSPKDRGDFEVRGFDRKKKFKIEMHFLSQLSEGSSTLSKRHQLTFTQQKSRHTHVWY